MSGQNKMKYKKDLIPLLLILSGFLLILWGQINSRVEIQIEHQKTRTLLLCILKVPASQRESIEDSCYQESGLK